MTSSKLTGLLLLILVILIAVFLGCSDKTFTSTTTSVSQSASPTAYIPLEQGLRVGYIILEPETEYFDLEVTQPANIAGNPGFTIRKTNRNSGEIEFFYRYEKNNAIFESGSTDTPGERILESPFVVGNSWDRFETTPGTDDPIDFGNDEEEDEINKEGNDIPWDLPKTRPDGSYSTMSIVGVETVVAFNNVSYGHCLKVAWQTGESSYNYYWYAPGIGLVKFEQNFNSLEASSNHTVGVMTDYQIVEY
jgi:hypothetical protein